MNKKFPSEIINYYSTTLTNSNILEDSIFSLVTSLADKLVVEWGPSIIFTHQDFNEFWQIWKKLCWAISILQSSSPCLSSFVSTIRQLSLQVEIPKSSNNTNDSNSSFYIFCFCPSYYDCTQQPPPQQQQQWHFTSFNSSVQSDVQVCIL